MKRLWKILNWMLPDYFEWLPKLLTAFIFLVLIIDAFHWSKVIAKHSNELVFISDSSPSLEIIKKLDLQSALQNLLWRRGESWETLNDETKSARRSEALEKLINQTLIKQFAAKNEKDSLSSSRETEEAFQQFLKQFPPPDEWKERIEKQGLTETELRNRIALETQQLTAIESWLTLQPGKVTDADARAWFDAHKDSLTVPERVRASHVFLTNHDKDQPDREPEIRELHRKLVAKEATLEELAREFSDDDGSKLRGGDLGWFARNRVPAEFSDKVFALPTSEINEPFESHLGWHILVVREKLPARTPEFAEVSEEITAMLNSQWRETALKRLVNELREKAKIEMFESRIVNVHP